MGMATVFPQIEDPFDLDTVKQGMGFRVAPQFLEEEDVSRGRNMRFVTFYHDDPIFEYWQNTNGKTSQMFSIWDVDILERAPEYDWFERKIKNSGV